MYEPRNDAINILGPNKEGENYPIKRAHGPKPEGAIRKRYSKKGRNKDVDVVTIGPMSDKEYMQHKDRNKAIRAKAAEYAPHGEHFEEAKERFKKAQLAQIRAKHAKKQMKQ